MDSVRYGLTSAEQRIHLYQPAGNNCLYAVMKDLDKSKMTHKNLCLHKSRGEGKESNTLSEARATGL